MSHLTLVPIHDVLPRGKRVDSPTDLHRAVMGLFGVLPGTPRQEGSILFRIEQVPGRTPAFLIRSNLLPEDLPKSARVKQIVDSDWLTEGRPVAFRLAVNAIQRLGPHGIRSVKFDDERELKPNEIRMTDWLQRKLDGALAEITLLRHDRTVLGVDRDGRPIRAEDHPVQVDLVDGVGKVDAPAALIELMVKGVGRSKAYGCGLLTVKPLR